MPHFIAFRFEIGAIVFVTRRSERNLFGNSQIESAVDERVDFLRIVSHRRGTLRIRRSLSIWIPTP